MRHHFTGILCGQFLKSYNCLFPGISPHKGGIRVHMLLGRHRNVLVFQSSHNNYHKLIGFRTIYIYYLMVWPSEVGMNFTGLDQGVDQGFFPGGSRREYVFFLLQLLEAALFLCPCPCPFPSLKPAMTCPVFLMIHYPDPLFCLPFYL